MKPILMLVLGALVALATVAASFEEAKDKVAANPAATASNAFALDLYGQLGREKAGKNLFFSPYSVCNALVIVAEGARGATAEEMDRVLHLPRSASRDLGPIHAGLAALNRRFEAASRPASKKALFRLGFLRKELEAANKRVREVGSAAAEREAQRLAGEINQLQARVDRYELNVANALWAEKNYPFKQSYLDVIRKYHGASAFPVDFRKAPERARKRINGWVEEKTRERIKDLVPPGAVDDLTRLVVTNAIYFKGQWSEPFPTRGTKDAPFTLADGSKVQAALMHDYLSKARYGAFTEDGALFDTPRQVPERGGDPKKLYPGAGGFEMLELPYKGDELSMVVLLPRSAGGLAALEKKFRGADLQTWIGKLQGRTVEVFLPKFRLESSFALKPALEALGIKRAFTDPTKKGGAEFDGMSEASDPMDKLYISKVLHKAFVEVSEKGTEAAAATAIEMKKAEKEDAPVMVPFTPVFRADRPFVFLIRDRQSGGVLFLGRVVNPKGAR
jgi:serine protease inhibitor